MNTLMRRGGAISGLLLVFVMAGCAGDFFAKNNPEPALVLPKGVSIVTQGANKNTSLNIPYQKYRLTNGLTLILMPDHSDPLVHVDVTYHVGSAREAIGQTGFAHFFEHMMFQGSKHVGDQQHFKLITEAGGTLNGTTNRDRTNYYETVPSNQLEKVLWLESDRMGFLLDAVSQHKFEIQRDTVKNEKMQNYDNRPYGLIWEKVNQALYPNTHPYSWPTIGYVEDLNRVSVDDLKAFFTRWYGPNNAVLTIGGDIDPQTTLDWVAKYFSSIPKGPEVKPTEVVASPLVNDRFITLEDNIKQPMILLTWPSGKPTDKNTASLDMLASILGDGPNSLLYQSFVKTQKAVGASAFNRCGELACDFSVYLLLPAENSGTTDKVYDQLMRLIDAVSKKQVTGERVAELKGRAEADAYFALQSVSGKVSFLAENETFYQKPDRMNELLKGIEAVTPESILSAYGETLKSAPKVVLSVVPKGMSDKAIRLPNFTPLKRSIESSTNNSGSTTFEQTPKFEHLTSVIDDFDRSVMPKVAGPIELTVPDNYQFSLANGAKVIGTEVADAPLVELYLKLPAGNNRVPKEKSGLAQLTALMMEEGSVSKTAEQLQSSLDKLGASVSFQAGEYYTLVSISTLKKHLPTTLKLLNEILTTPKLAQADFERLQTQLIASVDYNQQQLGWLAGRARDDILFANTFLANPIEGFKDSLARLSLTDVQHFYQQNYTPVDSQVILVGALDKAQAKKTFETFAKWHKGQPSSVAPLQLAPLGEPRIYLVDKPGATQSMVQLVRRALPFDATGEAYLMTLTNFNFAGNFNSRLNQNLRENKGFTYGVSGGVMMGPQVGALVLSAKVRQDATLESIKEIIKELKHFSTQGLTDEEVQFMRLAVSQQEALAYETPSQKASLLSELLTYQLSADYLKTRNDIVATVTKKRLNELAAKWFSEKAYQILVIGDATQLMPALETLNMPITRIDTSALTN